jgi:glucokinase
VKGSRPTGAQRGHEATIRDMAVCRLNSWRKCGLTLSDIDAIGIGIPGVITTTA